MATLLDNPTFAADFQPLLTALIANPADGPTQQAFITNLTALLNEWASTSALGAQVIAQNQLVQNLLTQFLAVGVKGSVANAAALPTTPATGAVQGAAYFVQDTWHLYAYVNGQWLDIGVAGTSLDLTNISPAGVRALNRRILRRAWLFEG